MRRSIMRQFMYTVSVGLLSAVSSTCVVSAADTLSQKEHVIATPWSDEWPMNLRGVERWFAEYEGVSYLEVIETDWADVTFLVAKDVLIQGKFKEIRSTGVMLYNVPFLNIGAATEAWSTILDGDNVYVLGNVRRISGDGSLVFRSKHVLRAPSDAVLITQRLAAIDGSDLPALIAFAASVRSTGKSMGNRDVWMTAADRIVEDAVTSMAQQAEQEKNVHKLLQAMRWSGNELADAKRAAKLGSSAWVVDLSDDQVALVSEQMSTLGLTFFEGSWLTKRDKIVHEFERRLTEVPATDAQAYYDAAMSIARYRDVLPESLELKHKALQLGLRNNPRSNLLRRALGMNSIEDHDQRMVTANVFRHTESGLAVTPPAGWTRQRKAIDGDVTWIDPSNTTAYISLQVLPVQDGDGFFEIFAGRMNPYKRRIGYQGKDAESLGIGSASKVMRFSFMEGSERRDAIAGMAFFLKQRVAVYVYASYVEEDTGRVDAAFAHIIEEMESLGIVGGVSAGTQTEAEVSQAEPKESTEESNEVMNTEVEKTTDVELEEEEGAGEEDTAPVQTEREKDRETLSDEELYKKYGP